MENGIKIMNLEGAEILKNNLEELSINKDYKGVFANSLLSDKLIELGLKVHKKSNTTRDIIMINFKYGYTPQDAREIENKINENKILIKNIIEDKKILIEKRKTQLNNNDKKPYTLEIDKLAEDIKNLKDDNIALENEIEELKMSKDKVREKLYQEGFHLDFYKKDKTTNEFKVDKTINYSFWYRSPSKSKTGSVCFINEELYNDINIWQTMGIELPSENAKLVEMEAYKSLTSSAIESKIIINPFTEILVVNDLDSYIEEMCSKVYVNRTLNANANKYKITKCTYKIVKGKVADNIINAIRKNRTCSVEKGIMKIKNTIWDGMALLENDLFSGSNGMMVLRQHFFKVCGFRTYIQKFMKQWCLDNNKDYNTYTVKDRYGRDVFVKNLKCITTENAMKWEKFSDDRVNYEYWCSKVQEDNNLFGVCKIDHESKYGSKQRMSFQMVNTLPIDSIETFHLCKDTIEYVNSLKADNEIFIQSLERTKSDMNSNEMMVDLYKNNKGFSNSELFRKYKKNKISEYKETLRAGKLLTNSDNLTVCGNPYSLLLHSVGELDKYIVDNNVIEGFEDKTLPALEKDKGVSVYTTRFNNEELCAFRSPHNSPNNILFFRNLKDNLLMDTYFPFSKNIIAVNLFNTNCQSRGNGFDEDADFFYVTNNKICVEASKTAQKFNTIVNCIEQSGKKYNNTKKDLAKIDNGLAKSRYSIGLSSNLAQLAMSWYWNNPIEELADIVCIMSVLAQCSIDNSKRIYRVNLEKEIARISKLDCMQVKINEEKEMVILKEDMNEEEIKAFKKLKMAKPYFWKFIKTIKESEVDKIIEKKVCIKDMTDEQIQELRLAEKQRVLDLKITQKQKAGKEKTDKVNKLNEHCIDNKICPMDFIQDAIDTINLNTDNTPYSKDVLFIKPIEGKANEKQQNKVLEIVKSLDDMYKAHFDNLAKNVEIDEDEWKVEQLIKSKNTLESIQKIKLAPKTMQMLITNTLKNNKENKKYKRRMLNCLYKAQKDLFLSCFKSEK